ncbi:uncharacterized protein [Coffea arabica]|uniref:Uncharacterized protein n=1 Tax=Coffea arabica TaxID=13443 RepID=A0A6P6T817_COFAR|nr:zinc finger protein SHOOT GRAVITROPISM 5-like [Coffea arabica]
MEEGNQKELQLLPADSQTTPSSSNASAWPSSESSIKLRSTTDPFEGPSLDLQLSISFRTIRTGTTAKDYTNNDNLMMKSDPSGRVEALKWQAAEEIRLAAMEKAYAERVRELSRREMELAQTEFARARNMWERARDEVEKAEKLKERATRQMDSTCMEITCQSCRQKFRPS